MASLLMRRRVQIAIAEEPDKSDSDLAEELGVNEKTIRAARRTPPKLGKLQCVGCGQTVDAGCFCNLHYISATAGSWLDVPLLRPRRNRTAA